jgi:hypothetical protein
MVLLHDEVQLNAAFHYLVFRGCFRLTMPSLNARQTAPVLTTNQTTPFRDPDARGMHDHELSQTNRQRSDPCPPEKGSAQELVFQPFDLLTLPNQTVLTGYPNLCNHGVGRDRLLRGLIGCPSSWLHNQLSKV